MIFDEIKLNIRKYPDRSLLIICSENEMFDSLKYLLSVINDEDEITFRHNEYIEDFVIRYFDTTKIIIIKSSMLIHGKPWSIIPFIEKKEDSFSKTIEKKDVKETISKYRILVVGQSGSGKTTLIEELINRDIGLHNIIRYTTRAKRDYEEEGKEYHFISYQDYHTMMNKRDIIFTSRYEMIVNEFERTIVYYGTKVSDFVKGSISTTSSREIANTFMSDTDIYLSGGDVILILLYVPKEDRINKLITRGDDILEINRRADDEDIQFNLLLKKIKEEESYKHYFSFEKGNVILINNEGYKKTNHEIADEVINRIFHYDDMKK